MHDRRGSSTEVVVLVLVLVVALVGGGVGLFVWTRSAAVKASGDARAMEAATSRNVIEQMREAESLARKDEPEGSAATGGTGVTGASGATNGVGAKEEAGKSVKDAMGLTRLVRTAVDAADTAARKEEARGLIDRALIDLDAGKVEGTAEALATLRVAIGTGYSAVGEKAAAVRELTRAVAERKKLLGERHPDTIKAEMDLEDAGRK